MIKQNMVSTKKEHWILLGGVVLALIVSAYKPFDGPTWALEIFPVVLGIPLLIYTYPKFRLTDLLYRLLFIHALILIIGGHYTYARVPLGFWIQDLFHLARNHYDRLGHLAQGFIPAILAREILLRRTPLKNGGWLFFIVVSICLAFSAFYEFIEWGTALVAGEGATDFLGTQGDPWDTQWDMFLAFVGSLISLTILTPRHDKELTALLGKPWAE